MHENTLRQQYRMSPFILTQLILNPKMLEYRATSSITVQMNTEWDLSLLQLICIAISYHFFC